jgi:hypothetical protein
MTKISTLTEQCASAHYHDEISSPDSAIILDVFGGTDIAKPPGSTVA